MFNNEGGQFLVVRRILTVPKVEEEDWPRTNILQSRVKCCDRVYNLIIDSGCSMNVIVEVTLQSPYKVDRRNPTIIKKKEELTLFILEASYLGSDAQDRLGRPPGPSCKSYNGDRWIQIQQSHKSRGRWMQIQQSVEASLAFLGVGHTGTAGSKSSGRPHLLIGITRSRSNGRCKPLQT